MALHCTWAFTIVPSDSVDVPDAVSRIMERLLDEESHDPSLSDSAVALDLDTMTVEIGMAVTRSTFEESVQAAMTAIGSAIRAAGASAPGAENALVFQPGELVAA